MSKIRLVSKQGDAIGLAFIMNLEGSECDFYLKDPSGPDVYKNMPIERVKEWQAGINKKNDTILFDMVSSGDIADKKRKVGYNVYGAGSAQDTIELDRGAGLDVAGDCGILLPYSVDYQDFGKAIEEIESDKMLSVVTKEPIQAFCFKPEGNKGCAKTYPARNREDIVRYLKYAEKTWQGPVDFVLQEMIEGAEVSSECWFVNGEPLVGSFNNTFELKRDKTGDKGPNTGCQFSAVKFNAYPKLYDLFDKIGKWCKKVKLHGPLDLNCMVSKIDGKPYLLEFTPRMGYSAMYAFVQGLNMKVADFISACARGEMPDLKPSTDWLGALRCTIAPYPHSEEAQHTKYWPVSGIGRFDWKNVVPLDMMIDEDGELCGSGFDGIICEVCDKGPDLKTLCKTMEKRADALIIPDLQYRVNTYDDIENRIKILDSFGYDKA